MQSAQRSWLRHCACLILRPSQANLANLGRFINLCANPEYDLKSAHGGPRMSRPSGPQPYSLATRAATSASGPRGEQVPYLWWILGQMSNLQPYLNGGLNKNCGFPKTMDFNIKMWYIWYIYDWYIYIYIMSFLHDLDDAAVPPGNTQIQECPKSWDLPGVRRTLPPRVAVVYTWQGPPWTKEGTLMSCGRCGRLGVPSGKLTVCYWKWPIIVDLPIKSKDFQ